MACLLKVYVARFSSGVSNVRFERAVNDNSEPRREQIEQLHEIAPSISISTSNSTFPQ
jgi:hypothetical protein